MSMLPPTENKKDSALVRDFMGHLITGGGLFLLAAAVSMLIEFAADFADGFPKFWHLALVFHASAILFWPSTLGVWSGFSLSEHIDL